MSKNYFFLLIIIIGIGSCSKPANNGVPSYLKIESVSVETTPSQGTALHNISDLWIESEGVNLGVFEYPNVIPALFEGTRDVLINPGIFQSGDFFVREIYPAFQVFSTTATFVTTDTVIINPVFRYKSTVDFIAIESFETGNIFAGLDRTDLGDPNNLEGKCGVAYLTENNNTLDVKTGNPIAIGQGSRVFVEFHYKGSNDFGFGIEALNNGSVTSSTFFAGLTPSDDWRKLYIEITNTINAMNGDEYNFYLQAAKLDNLTESTVFIDNIKIVTI